ncbi:EscU/YscU/HrcU family type III secretion system export apparatus switch protein [Sphingomonas sp.]|uniref:EscU/YscU/HrcU family type III secretion system export apparatus switch protein n=1 Tax=Sphingomonas sp. TaxID=28214 RepID=UPI001B1F5EA5|nr:EscU/YscU/HrcU family type III secretion system export apparatus switch protein [Sphingomonas sp.]MBO9714814.1 EscU/YscU/HrcU family type III secretion system export apparatus switch protein [Sphingomonas sp.]
MAEQEQNRSEAPTPFKLKRAREKGMVARSVELGFLGGLIALAAFSAIAGPAAVTRLAQLMRVTLSAGVSRAADPEQAQAMIGEVYWAALSPLLLLGGTIMGVVIFLEILQLRGLIFTAQPLKPDFSRLNPAKGIKRLFSMRMLKETLKTIAKAAVYATAAWLVLHDATSRYAPIAADGERLASAMGAAGLRLILVFAAIALGFVILDQLLVRGEFLKQMRMSRREVTREAKDREGDPRIKQKRKQLHAEFAKQSKGLGALPGSDLLVVNPEHYAVALRYDPETMTAPTISAKGRNNFALALRAEAARLGVPVLRRPELARALFRGGEPGREIPTHHYEAVAALYIALRHPAARPEGT